MPAFLPVTEDVDGIMLVMTEAFDPAYGEAWSRRQVEDALRIGNCHYLLCSDEGDYSGFALSRHGFEEEELLLFAVRPQYRRRGIGRTLLCSYLNAAEERGAKRVFLEMREGNPAKWLYEDIGFARIGTRREYYRMATGLRLDAHTYEYEFKSSDI